MEAPCTDNRHYRWMRCGPDFEDDRREVVAMYARLLARAVREGQGKENNSDDVND